MVMQADARFTYYLYLRYFKDYARFKVPWSWWSGLPPEIGVLSHGGDDVLAISEIVRQKHRGNIAIVSVVSKVI